MGKRRAASISLKAASARTVQIGVTTTQLQTMIDGMTTSALERAEDSQVRAAALGRRIDTNYLGMIRRALAERRRLGM